MKAQYQGSIIIVTGASGGIGRAIALELAGRGGHVALVARRENELARVAEEITAAGGAATAIPCDVTDETGISAAVRQIKDRFGRVDLLVNNAGRELVLPLQVTKPQAARDLLDINVVATAMVSRACLGLLPGGGAIVNVASVTGIVGAGAMSLYAASKAAIVGFTRSLARELAGRRVRVNAVAPGLVRTEMLDRMFRKFQPEQIVRMEADYPLGLGSPEDVARGVAFLGSSEAAWITGQTLVIDGGFFRVTGHEQSIISRCRK